MSLSWSETLPLVFLFHFFRRCFMACLRVCQESNRATVPVALLAPLLTRAVHRFEFQKLRVTVRSTDSPRAKYFCSSAISHKAMPKTLIARSNFLNKWHHMAAKLLESFLIRHPEESGSPCFFDCVKASTAFWTSAQCRWTRPWSSYKSKSLGCRNCVPKLQGLFTCCIKHIKHIKQFRMDHNINIQLTSFGILGRFLFATGVWIWSFTLTLCPHHS